MAIKEPPTHALGHKAFTVEEFVYLEQRSEFRTAYAAIATADDFEGVAVIGQRLLDERSGLGFPRSFDLPAGWQPLRKLASEFQEFPWLKLQRSEDPQ